MPLARVLLYVATAAAISAIGRTLIIGLRDDYLKVGLTQEDAARDGGRLLDAEKQGGAAVALIWKEIEDRIANATKPKTSAIAAR